MLPLCKERNLSVYNSRLSAILHTWLLHFSGRQPAEVAEYTGKLFKTRGYVQHMPVKCRHVFGIHRLAYLASRLETHCRQRLGQIDLGFDIPLVGKRIVLKAFLTAIRGDLTKSKQSYSTPVSPHNWRVLHVQALWL